jgi:hypothetical protein
MTQEVVAECHNYSSLALANKKNSLSFFTNMRWPINNNLSTELEWHTRFQKLLSCKNEEKLRHSHVNFLSRSSSSGTAITQFRFCSLLLHMNDWVNEIPNKKREKKLIFEQWNKGKQTKRRMIISSVPADAQNVGWQIVQNTMVNQFGLVTY